MGAFPPPPTVMVISEDEGFDSGSLSGSTREDTISVNKDKQSKKLKSILNQLSPIPERLSFRRMSFFVDIDPTTTPPSTPMPCQRRT